jgi:predicted transglutaminase-like cysteine proteinase
MKIKTVVGAALLASAIHSTIASAASVVGSANDENGLFAREFGETLPPVGYVNFCASNKGECNPYAINVHLRADRLAMTPDRWNALYKINTFVNGKIKPVSDQQLYGVAERWVIPTSEGDCEDYVLLKKRMLEKAGISPHTLKITVVLDERNDGHAVLTVSTNEGDFILDNRRNGILLWNDTNYTFLKRQSQDNPRKWVALLTKPDLSQAVASAKSR